ncbi:putative short-chain dehydrogenase [Xylariaceae sp. AK1471]|nr:putative short-chain dehydrogenase [Xylariaceae sp. AK1471]
MANQKTIVLITGANSGIGLEVANQLLADSSFHVLLGARLIEKGQVAIKNLQSRNLPGAVELVQLDVANEDSVSAAAKLIGKTHGRLDVLVNNAGIARAEGTLAQEMVECFRVNAVGAQLMGDYFAHLLKKSAGVPRIINATSGAGSISTRIDPNGVGSGFKVIAYRVSKAAMNMVFACQHRELEGDGFKVFLYGPGPTISGLRPNSKGEGSGKKPTSVSAAPIVEMVKGSRDADAGKYLEYGHEHESFPW